MNWDFPTNNYGQINGIADAGVETFQGTPLKSLAREICQNSLDAGIGEIVEVEFSTFSVKPNDFSGLDSLKKANELALSFWEIQSDRKAKDFFKNAINILEEESISFLRISDFKTSGLTGSKEEYNTPWSNLTKSSGSSDKSGVSGGSFGIGKFAPFACSHFRTVFYSTLDKEGVSASQGVSRIASFRNYQDEITQGVGYFGGEKNSPVFELANLDPLFNRSENGSGTDIYVAGFKYAKDDWKSDIITSILDGFLLAIWQGSLIVNVEGIEISRRTLPDLIDEFKGSITENADKYYYVLSSDETRWFNIDYRNYGNISLGLIINPDMHRKVAMVRKTGMKIMDKGNISGVIPFAGVLVIEGEKINKYLRNLENPQHTKWEEQRAVNPLQAREMLKGITTFIKDCVDEIKNDDSNEELDADVGEYLPDEVEVDASKENKEVEMIPNTVRSFEKSTVTRKPPAAKTNDNSEKSEQNEYTGNELSGHENKDEWTKHGTNTSTGGERNPDSGKTDNHGSAPKQVLSEITASKIRVVCLDKHLGDYSISFTPDFSASDGVLEVFLSAESGNYEAMIKSAVIYGAPELQVHSNKIKDLIFTANKSIRVRVNINYSDYCSMEVKAYGYKV